MGAVVPVSWKIVHGNRLSDISDCGYWRVAVWILEFGIHFCIKWYTLVKSPSRSRILEAG